MIGFHVILLLRIFRSVATSIPETSLTMIYVYKSPMSWNDAKEACQTKGEHLLTINGNVRNVALTAVLKQLQQLSIKHGMFWIGLHHMQNSTYRWSDCAELSTWQKWNQSSINESEIHQCVSVDESASWTPTNCSRKLPFICEKIIPCGCYLQRETEICMDLVRSQSTLIANVSLEECKQLCMSHVNGQDECWGLSYGFSLCHLHERMKLTATPCYVNHYYFTKVCFSYQYISTTLAPSMADESYIPNINCSFANASYSETTTSTPCTFYDVTTISNEESTVRVFMTSSSNMFSTVPETSTEFFNPSTTPPNCVCYTAVSNITIEQRIEQLVADLKVDVKNTTMSRMKKISAPDHRPSAKTIGVVGVIALVMVFGGIILLDIERLRNDVTDAVNKIKHHPMC